MKRNSLLSGVFVLLTAAAAMSAQPQLTIVASGLNNPRGLGFGPNGVLYVAEAGLGAGDEQGGFGLGLGFTGSITEIRDAGTPHPRWQRLVTGLVSVGDTEQGFPEVLGPDGLSVFGSGGIYVTIGESCLGELAKDPNLSTQARAQLGRLIKITPGGTWKVVANVGDFDYFWTGVNKDAPWAPADQFPDANPYGVVAVSGRQYVADAGANTINEVRPDGSVRIIAFVPNPMLPLPDGDLVPVSDAVPTCVALGGDGFLYVGTLAFGANFGRFGPTAPPNWKTLPPQSKIYRVNPKKSGQFLTEANVWAAGFNPITACAFGNGALYVTEYATEQSEYATGQVVRVALQHNGSAGERTALGTGALHQPNGLALGKGGGIYVSNYSISSGEGEVVRVNY